MKPLTHLFAAALGMVPFAADAFGLDLPGNAQQAVARIEAMGSYALPVSAWRNGNIETHQTEGEVVQQAWHLPGDRSTTLQILKPLRHQLVADGFDILFECEARQCGGFEFRYGMDVLPEPEMHVDLGDFRYLAAQRLSNGEAEHVSLMISRSASRGFVQVVRVGAPTAQTAALVTSTKSPTTDGAADTVLRLATNDSAKPERLARTERKQSDTPATMIEQLVGTGRSVLGDLSFKTGSSQLNGDQFDSLTALAAFLIENPGKEIVLVGHTDAEGSLASNVALSKKRAGSVLQRLANEHGIAKSRMKAEGVGYLMPLATNATEEGRNLNRRVEVVISTTE